MTRTHTRTFTNVYVVGELLANSSNNFELARKTQKELEIKFADELLKGGIKFVETDDINQISLMKSQWQILALIIPKTEITRIIDLL